MDQTVVQNSAIDKSSSAPIKDQLASYLEMQSESTRSLHRGMKILESIGFGIILVNFVTALVLSFLWKSVPVAAIPTAWLLLPVSGTIFTLLIAIHSLILRAFPPSDLFLTFQRGPSIRRSEKSQRLLTGKAAAPPAWGLILTGLFVGGFFAVFAWGAWTTNWAILIPMINILGILMGVGIVASILFTMAQKIFKAR